MKYKILKNCLYFIICTLLFNSGYAQDILNDLGQKKNYYDTESKVEVIENNDTVFVTTYTDKVTNKKIVNSIYKGTPFYKNRNFVNSELFISGGKLEGNIFYNVVQKNILFNSNNSNISTIIKPDSFLIDNVLFKKLYPEFKKAFYQDYYENIYSAKDVKLYKNLNSSLQFLKIPLEVEYNHNKEIINLFYNKNETFFLSVKNNFVEINSHNKLLNTFGKHKKELAIFEKSNKLNYRKEADLIKLIAYYSNLVGSFGK